MLDMAGFAQAGVPVLADPTKVGVWIANPLDVIGKVQSYRVANLTQYVNIDAAASNGPEINSGGSSKNLTVTNTSVGNIILSTQSVANAFTLLNNGNLGIGTAGTGNAKIHGKASAAGVIAGIDQGAASQTANLREWQNSAGTVLSSVDKDGYHILPGGLRFIGFTTSAGGASTTEYPNNKDCGIHINTTLASVRLCFNNAGAIVTVLLA